MKLGLGLAALLAAVALAACGSEQKDAPATNVTTGSNEEDLTVHDVKCRSESNVPARFDVVPRARNGRTELVGTLTDPTGTVSVFTCVVGADGKVTCEEVAQNPRSGAWNVALQRDGEDRGLSAHITAKAADDGSIEILLSCASVHMDTTPPAYTKIAPYIHAACGGCHGDRFDTFQKVKDQQDIMLAMISSGAMPRRDTTWKDREEGKAVLAYLSMSPELH